MRSCPRHLHLRILRGGTGWDAYSKYRQEEWYVDKYMPWFIITLGVIWMTFLIILAII